MRSRDGNRGTARDGSEAFRCIAMAHIDRTQQVKMVVTYIDLRRV